MEDHKNVSMRNAETRKSLVASRPKGFSRGAYEHIVSLGNGMTGGGMVGGAAAFLLKVAALEVVRRFSEAKCPFAWRGLQALQFLCYPPFKWIQRWAPFRGLVKSMKTLSKPLLILSIATAFSEELGSGSENTDSNNDSQANPDGSSDQVPLLPSASDARICNDASQVEPESWLFRLRKELENQGISIPERINEDELGMFYAASNGDLSSCLLSLKKTIRWRETYGILTEEELKQWSDMLFWHGSDVKHRPCLVVRLGLACFSLPSSERPRFAQAVISQMEYGVIHLVDAENTQITVLVDCEGLPPYRIPMQMIRSCFSLLQDHYPNRLGCLFVIRLPPVVRVIAQTLIQVLRPATREKLRIEGEMYQKVLSECLQMLPLYLGGKCTCERCRNVISGWHSEQKNIIYRSRTRSHNTDGDSNNSEELMHFRYDESSGVEDSNAATFNQVVRTSMFAILMLWLLFALIAGLWDPDTRPFASSP